MAVKMEELEAKIKVLEEKVRILEDIEEIKKLQKAYGYYLEHGMADQLIDLFSDGPETALLIARGEFRGKASIQRFFSNLPGPKNPEFLHQVMQLSGIVDVAPDGRTAQGRWYGFGATAMPVEEGVHQWWMNGVYENDYIKENGKWKIKIIHWCTIFNALFKDGWVAPSRQVATGIKIGHPVGISDGPPENTMYPSGFICPFHYKNPVSER
jgi:hypothetical protein